MTKKDLRIVHFEDEPVGISWILDALQNRFIRLRPKIVDRLDVTSACHEPNQTICGVLAGNEILIEYIIQDDRSRFEEEIKKADATTLYILDVILGRENMGIGIWNDLVSKIDVERQVLFLTAYPAIVHQELGLPLDHPCIVCKPPNYTQFTDMLLDRLNALIAAGRVRDTK